MNRLIYLTAVLFLVAIAAWGANTFLHAAYTGHDHQGTPVSQGQRGACLITGLMFTYATAHLLWRAFLGPGRAKTGHRVP